VRQDKVKYREITVETSAFTIGDNYTPSDTMANGEKAHVGAVAYNRLPLGTHIWIDNVEYIVKDRAAYDDVVDIYMGSIQECEKYGRQVKTIKILEE
jgi:3D (Asp-Asp-Asp) domain-containing protein